MATQRKDGRWMARQMVDGKRIAGYGRTPEEAESDLKLKLQPIPLALPEMGITLNDFATAVWAPGFEGRLAPLTQKRYKGVYRKFIKFSIGKDELTAISPARVRSWLVSLPAGQELKAYVFSVLRAILQIAWKDELIPANPCSKVDCTAKKVKRERVLDVEEALAMLDHIKGDDLSAPVFLSTVLGLRLGEVTGLKWEDLDRQKKQLRIVRQRQEVRPHGVIERELKTAGSRRTLNLTDGIIREIDERGDLDSPYICTKNGKPWVPNTVGDRWRKAKGDLGLPDWHFHDLRHLAAGLLAAAGCDLLVIAAVLGHAKPDMSALYVSVSQARRIEGIEKLGELLNR